MKEIEIVNESKELIDTSVFDYMKFHFDKFNPVQSRLFEYYNKDVNLIISANTGSGKTECSEMTLSYDIIHNKKKGMYIVPFRSLAQEKYDDWTDKKHSFSKLNISICTGDYKLTSNKKKELENSDLIIMSSELLNHFCRNNKADNDSFLSKIGTLVIDECFPGNINISLNENYTKTIQEVVEDDSITEVLSLDFNTNKLVKKKIVRKLTRDLKDKKLVVVCHEFGKFICTEDHKIWTKNKNWVKAKDLSFEDFIRHISSKDDIYSRVISVKEYKNDEILKVYDLEIEDTHNYFANKVLVSNCHLIDEASRGHHLEAGMMKFTEINPKARLVLLSATIPNVKEIAEWCGYSLNKKDTVLIASKYRACPLNLHYEKYDDSSSVYEEREKEKIYTALDIIEYYPEDKFLIFAHTKKTGYLIKEYLAEMGIVSEFHNGDLTKDKRTKIEESFKNGNLRVIIATSTMEAGVNLPSRRVIILGIHRGISEISPLSVHQMCGRAGRAKYDKVGDAYVLLPAKTYDYQKSRIKILPNVESKMLSDIGGIHKNLCFHLVSEIVNEGIKDRNDVKYWYKRSFASLQSMEIEDVIVNNSIDVLKKLGVIWEEEDGILTPGAMAKISSLFYYSPFDIVNLRNNFNVLFDNSWEDNDYLLSFALGNIDTHRMGIVSKAEKESMSKYAKKIEELFTGNEIKESAIKAGYAYFSLMNGMHNDIMYGYMKQLELDFPRTNAVLQAIDSFCGKWNKKEWFGELELRIQYGVRSNLLPLCRLPNIGKTRAQKLFDAGITSPNSILLSPEKAKKILKFKEKTMDDLIEEINKINLVS